MNSAASPEYAALLFRWEITIVTIGCVIFLITTAMLGMRISQGRRTRRAAFWMTIAMPLFQFPASATRIFYSFSDSFKLPDPMSSYIDLFWSPICTLFLIWLYRNHLLRSCHACESDVSKMRIVYEAGMRKVLAAVTAGFLTSLSLDLCLSLEAPRLIVTLFYWLITFCAAGAMAEIVLARIVYGKVVLMSYSWLWYLGTWAYFVTRV